MTLPDGTVVDDDANKAVMWNTSMAFVYTGWATLPPDHQKKTYHWLAEALSDLEMTQGAFQELAARATRDFGATNTHQVFMAAGWGTDQATGDKFAVCITVSNAYGDEGWLAAPRPEFVVEHQVVPPAGAQLRYAPPLSNEDLQFIGAQLEFLSEQGTTGPKECAEVLVGAIRRVAAHNNAVGESVVLNCLPIDAPNSIQTASEPAMGQRSFIHYPAGTTRPHELAPAFVGPGIVIVDPRLNVPAGTPFVEFAESPAAPPGETHHPSPDLEDGRKGLDSV